MLVAAGLCPHPPLLVPEVAAGAVRETQALRSACLSVVDELRKVSSDRLVIVGDGPATAPVPAGACGSFAAYGVNLAVSLPGTPSADSLPLSLLVGGWLVGADGWPGPVSGWTVERGLDPVAAAELGARIAAEPGRTTLLAMGDCAVAATEHATAETDPECAAYDRVVADAVAGPDLAALAALTVEDAAALGVVGRASWQVLAGAAAGSSWQADLRYAGAPYGVGYVAALWTLDG